VISGEAPVSLAVNEATDKIYVANYEGGNVTVIDGATNSAITVTDPNANGPHCVAVNPRTNKIYVANFNSSNIRGSNNVTVILRVPPG